MRSTEKKRGHYLGTEINEKWWRRYFRGGLFSRGLGDYWFDKSALYFRRYLTKTPIVISYKDMLEVKVGKWHSGQWAAGAPVVKIIWKKADKRLSSGFVFSRQARETEALMQKIRSRLPQTADTAQQAQAADSGKRRR
jgi:hypothetical protein